MFLLHVALSLYDHAELVQEKRLPDLETLEKGRESKESYVLFCMKFLPGVTGTQHFKNGCCRKGITELCTISDEVMTFLILANNWEPWMAMITPAAEGDIQKKKLENCGVKQKYFKETKGRGHSWSREGKIYYNEMYDMIEEDRETNGEDFDLHFLECMKGESEAGKRMEKQSSKHSKHEEERIVIRSVYNKKTKGTKRTAEMSLPDSGGEVPGTTEEQKASEQAKQAGATNHKLV